MQPQFTLDEVFKFVVRRRANSQFKDWPVWKIFGLVKTYAARQQLHISADSSGITGMVIACPEGERLRIEQILCTTPEAFKVLRAACRHTYPGKDLVYFRHKHKRNGRWPAGKV